LSRKQVSKIGYNRRTQTRCNCCILPQQAELLAYHDKMQSSCLGACFDGLALIQRTLCVVRRNSVRRHELAGVRRRRRQLLELYHCGWMMRLPGMHGHGTQRMGHAVSLQHDCLRLLHHHDVASPAAAVTAQLATHTHTHTHTHSVTHAQHSTCISVHDDTALHHSPSVTPTIHSISATAPAIAMPAMTLAARSADQKAKECVRNGTRVCAEQSARRGSVPLGA